MLIDGIGLALIAACTVFEGYDDWNDPIRLHLKDNAEAVFLWFTGLNLAVGGLLFLIANAASFETIQYFEYLGVGMLTVAPLVNMVACSLFVLDKNDSSYNDAWMATEIVEFVGMGLLCLSYWPRNLLHGLTLEIAGYIGLSCAAMMDLTIKPHSMLIYLVAVRADHIHISDFLGLLLLIIVAIGKYHVHNDAMHNKHGEKRSPIPLEFETVPLIENSSVLDSDNNSKLSSMTNGHVSAS